MGLKHMPVANRVVLVCCRLGLRYIILFGLPFSYTQNKKATPFKDVAFL
jgi:hypothetical protein